MECNEPGSVSADDLFALAMGEDAGSAALHVATCPPCAAAVDAYVAADRVLHSRLARVDCPGSLALGELVLGVLDPSSTLSVRAHLADCPPCASDAKFLAAELAGDPLGEMLAGPSLLRRIIARLLPVPAPGTALGGVRGESMGGPRSYEAEDVSISLTDQPEGHGTNRSWTLLGLVDIEGAAPADGTEVRLTSSSGTIGTSRLDRFGNFSIVGLHPGTYGLELHFPDRVVAIEPVEIGSTPG
jgi:hypothetical protein